MTNKKEIVVYKDGELNIDVQFSPEEETVWLTQKQIELLYDVSQATVSEHIANILSTGELDQTSIGISDKSTGRRRLQENCRIFVSGISEPEPYPLQGWAKEYRRWNIGSYYADDCGIGSGRKRHNGYYGDESVVNISSPYRRKRYELRLFRKYPCAGKCRESAP